jgi:spore photoproduct lyase
VLQEYLDKPVMTLEARFSRILREIDALLEQQPQRFFRFGTGELSDSLALDPMTGLSEDYARFFSHKRNAVIEFKTKTDNIDKLKDAETANIVISWSINPQSLIEQEEFFTADIGSRLRAARECQSRGFLLGFHFDPILWTHDWEIQYKGLVDKLFSYVSGSRVAWISLGSLRFPPALKETALSRFPKSRIYFEEMIRRADGKIRYPKPMRIEMYRKIYQMLKERSPGLFIYFCMEPPDVWDRVMGRHPASNTELDFWFAVSLYKRFPDLDMDEPQLTSYTSYF